MICRFAICIPVYNNPKTIADIIFKTLQVAPDFPLYVVDDGSDELVEELYKNKYSSYDSGDRLRFIRHTVNQGKGVALQTAFQAALAGGYTHLVTLDGDDQHDPQDIQKLIDCAVLNPWSLIVGDRDMKTENVPGSSTFGKKFSNFWVQYQTNVGVSDSQSGYRLYPLFHIQNMKFYCTKYEFEIEVLIRLIWKGVSVKNVKVGVKYFPPETRVSHFHKLRDNFRITNLNICLTILSLLREQTSPVKSAWAFALGIFIGCIPIYGFHTLIVAGLAFILRLNFLYLWVGTNISFPVFIPFLLVAAHFLGHGVLSYHSEDSNNEAIALLTGSVLLGIILSIITFIVVYKIKSRNLNKTKKNWTGKNRNHAGILFVQAILQFLGVRPAYWFLRLVAFYYLFFSWRARRAFTEYWKVTHPEYGFFHRQIKIYQQIYIFAQSLVDRALQRVSMTQKTFYFDYILDASTNGFAEKVNNSTKGAVIVASHLGGWDMAMSFFAQLSSHKKMLAVMYGIPTQYQHHSLDKQDERAEVVFFNEGSNTILRMKNHLNESNVVTVMGDRPVSQSYELIPFFGKLAVFDTTPIRLAMACHSEVYFVFALKEKKKNYRIFTFEMPAVSSGADSKEEHIQNYLKSYTQHLEKILKDYPEQWFNFFPFWSTVPENKAD